MQKQGRDWGRGSGPLVNVAETSNTDIIFENIMFFENEQMDIFISGNVSEMFGKYFNTSLF